MSRSRHPEKTEGAPPPPRDEDLIVRSLALGLSHRHRLDTHDHPWPQLLYGEEGVMAFEGEQGAWVVPPLRAVWIPPGSPHAVETLGRLALRTLYFDPGLESSGGLGAEKCRVLHVAPLLRELILEVIRHHWLDRRIPAQKRLAAVLVDQLKSADEVPVDLPLPKDPRARRLADKVRAEPANGDPLPKLAEGCGATPRTLERLFRKETTLSFGRWRRHARLTHALELLAEGESVTEVALACGYEGTSAFIAMFKRELGTTPGKFLHP